MDITTQIKELHSQGISRRRASQYLGIDKEKLDLMLEYLNIDWKPGIRGGTYDVDGKIDTLENHSQRLGITVSALRYRLEKGKDLQGPGLAKQVTVEEAQQFYDLRKKGVTAKDAAAQVGRPYNTLKNAAKRYFSDYDDMIKSVARTQRQTAASNDDTMSLAS